MRTKTKLWAVLLVPVLFPGCVVDEPKPEPNYADSDLQIELDPALAPDEADESGYGNECQIYVALTGRFECACPDNTHTPHSECGPCQRIGSTCYCAADPGIAPLSWCG